MIPKRKWPWSGLLTAAFLVMAIAILAGGHCMSLGNNAIHTEGEGISLSEIIFWRVVAS